MGDALIYILLSYLIGSIPFGFILGKINNIDIRNEGSGNIGATNVLRTLGKKWGYSCFFVDFLKGFIVVSGGHYFLEDSSFYLSLSLAAVILGHMYSIFLNFQGGKGIATCMGGLLYFFPLSLLFLVLVWVVVFFVFGYVSLASIIIGILLPFSGLVERYFQNEVVMDSSILILIFIALGIVLKHCSNLKRLWHGQEYSFKKKEVSK